MSDEEVLPFNVKKDCPECGTEQSVRWPSTNPESVEIKCSVYDCRETITVHREEDG